MRRSASVLVLDVDGLTPSSQPLHVRVEERIRRAILNGSLAPQSRLPASRVLAKDLGVSRHTVERAYARLEADGFVARRLGSGTFVAPELPERELPPRGTNRGRPGPDSSAALSKRGEMMVGFRLPRDPLTGTTFTPSVPSLSWFPRSVWGRLLRRAVRKPGMDPWIYGASSGLPTLRAAIAAHVGATRGVACTPEQVVVVNSAHQAVDLTARVLLDVGDVAWIEDPHYGPAARLLAAAGARVTPVPVDLHGFDVEAARRTDPGARLVYVTPSHQYPSGGTMSMERRRALLDWAEREAGWIIEDDYDGDLRYVGRPLAALQALDGAGRVIYVGTSCKMMFPSLRVAFLVSPPALVDAFRTAKHLLDGHTAKHSQAALADFIQEGHLAAHLRRSIAAYDERRHAVLQALAPLEDALDIGPCEAGLHFTAYLRRPLDDRRISRACRRAGVHAPPLSAYYLGPARPGFVLGFGCSHPSCIPMAIRVLTRAMATEHARAPRRPPAPRTYAGAAKGVARPRETGSPLLR